MATRKINGFEYLLPGVDTAIKTLRPGARYDMKDNQFLDWIDDEGRQPPTWQEIEQEILRQVDVYNYYLYERQREEQYPDVKFQLDMLYHDIKNNNLQNGSWIKSIEEVKQKYPKPTTPPPH
tara:strand:- start:1405 stop:1770 length:366 start_codon:yes stop_codon:yes gene_type:complete